MNRIVQRLVVISILILTAAPWLMLAIAGFHWLWLEQWLWIWLALMVGCSLVAWLVARALRIKLLRPEVPDPLLAEPDKHWSKVQEKAWQRVESICERVDAEKPVLNDWNASMHLFRETVETVAAEFHPGQDQPFLEMHVPDLLRIVELLSNDLRELTTEHIPGSHIVTINDVLKGREIVGQMKKVYRWYRLASFALTPIQAFANEIRHRIGGDTVSLVYTEIKYYLICACVRKVGYYAIKLYSGELEFESGHTPTYITTQSEADRLESDKTTQAIGREPLRIAVVGQVNSGKSSLINCLYGELRVAVDWVPTTQQIQPYVLEKDGLPQAIVLDTKGYENTIQSKNAGDGLEQAIDSADLIILLCVANHPARDADKKLLQSMRERFRDYPRDCPECIVVLSHIDRLRPFREWSPPYCLNPAQGVKAQQIVAAMESTAADLDIALENVVPVNLQDGYNVEEALLPAMIRLLPEAKRSQYLRCLGSYRDERHWERIWRQSKGAGLLLVKAGIDWAQKSLKAD